MSAFINLSDNIYDGSLTNGESSALAVGQFVLPDWSAGTALLGTSDGDYDTYDVWMVANQDDSEVDDYTDSSSYRYSCSRYYSCRKRNFGVRYYW